MLLARQLLFWSSMSQCCLWVIICEILGGPAQKWIGILCNPENFQWWTVGREWWLSTPTCMSEQISFRMVIAILSPDLSHTPSELRLCHQRKTWWVNVLVCRSSIQGCTFSCGQLLMLKRKPGSAVTALPRLWPPPSSPLHSDDEVVQLFSCWVYGYTCSERTMESSNFLIIFAFLRIWCAGKRSTDFKAVSWWSLPVRGGWLLLGTKYFVTLHPVPFLLKGGSLHTCRRCVLSLLYYHIIYHIYEKKKRGTCFLRAIMTTVIQTGQSCFVEEHGLAQ